MRAPRTRLVLRLTSGSCSLHAGAARALVALAGLIEHALDPMKLAQHAPFIPHAAAALELARDAGVDEEAGMAATRLANYSHTRGDYAVALVAAEQAERHFRTAFDDGHEVVAVALGIRGYVLSHQGDLDGALHCFAEAERILRNLDEALHCYAEAERIVRKAFGDDHPNVATVINNRGNVLQDKGDLDGALHCYAEAERFERKAFGDDHPRVAAVINNRGSVLQDKGDLDGARALYREAFSIVLRKLGSRAVDTLVGADNLSALGLDPIATAREIAGAEVAAELERHFRARLAQSR